MQKTHLIKIISINIYKSRNFLYAKNVDSITRMQRSTKVEIFYMQKTMIGFQLLIGSTKVEIFYMQKT